MLLCVCLLENAINRGKEEQIGCVWDDDKQGVIFIFIFKWRNVHVNIIKLDLIAKVYQFSRVC